jgi:2-keto-3-deoxy-galactonokinase
MTSHHRTELLKEAVPGASQVAVMLNPDDPTDADAFKAYPAAASALGLSARLFAVRAATEFEGAFAAASRANLQGMHVSHAPWFTNACLGKNCSRLICLPAPHAFESTLGTLFTAALWNPIRKPSRTIGTLGISPASA